MSRAACMFVGKAAGVFLCALVLAGGESARGQTCVGDCDADGKVLVSELILGVEHSLLPELVVGIQGTYRLITDIHETRRLLDPSACAAGSSNLVK